MAKFKATFTNKLDAQDIHAAWFDSTDSANAWQAEINGRGDLMPDKYDFAIVDKTAEVDAIVAKEQNRKDAGPRLLAIKSKLDGATPLTALEVKAIIKDMLALLRVE